MTRTSLFFAKTAGTVVCACLFFFASPATALRGSRGDLDRNVRNVANSLENDLGHPVRLVVQRDSVASNMRAVGRVVMATGFSLRMNGGNARERAEAFLSMYGGIMGLENPSRNFRFRRTFRWAAGETVRFDIMHEGRKVFGRDIAVRLQDDHVTGVFGGLPPVDTWDTPDPVSNHSDIRQYVLRASGRPPSRILNLGYLVYEGRGTLVWRVDQYTPPHQVPPQRFILAVEDRTGLVRVVGKGFTEALGNVFDHTPLQGPPVEVELPDLVSDTALRGTYANAYRCAGSIYDWPPCSPLENNAVPDSDGNYFYEPIEPSLTDAFAEVHAYYHATMFSKWLEETFGFVWECGGSRAIDVHVNMDYPNAFYGDANGDPFECADITLGQGDVDFAYDSEVLFHEFGHGVVDQTAGLGCPDMGVCIDGLGLNLIPMGLNEGYADYYSMTYTDNPDIGEYVASEYGEPYLRSAINPNQCPWDVTSQSHYDGQIWSAVAWTLRSEFGSELGDALVHGALLSLPQDVEFAVAGAVLLETAEQMQAQNLLSAEDVELVRHTVGPEDRNLLDCYRIIPLDNRPEEKKEAYGYGMPTYRGYIDEFPVGLHWTVYAPANVNSIRIYVSALIGYGSEWRVYLNENDHAYVQVSMMGTSVFADHQFDGSPGIIELNSFSDPPVKPDTTYYIAIVYSADWGEYFQIHADVETGEPLVDGGVIHIDAEVSVDAAVDASPPDAADHKSMEGKLSPRGGCNCRAGGSGHTPIRSKLPVVLFFFAFFVILASRRRKRA